MMNETQKTLIILGLLFILLGVAQHFLFVQRLGSRLIVEQTEFELYEFSESVSIQLSDSLTLHDEMRLSKLETRVKWSKAVQYFFLIGCIPFFVAACFFRAPKTDDDFEDEWEDDEWDNDE